MKSSVESLIVGLYLSLLKDFEYVSPTMRPEIEVASSRLQSIISSRGLGFFTLTLPDCAKMLEKALSTGKLPSDRPPYHGAKSSEDLRPRFLWGLWSLVFDTHGLLRSDSSEEAVGALRQLYLFAKKLRLPCPEDKVNESLIEFLATDASLPPSHAYTWDCNDPQWKPRLGHPLWGTDGVSAGDGETDLFGQALHPIHAIGAEWWDLYRDISRFLVYSFGEMVVWDMRPKHGPGAIADRSDAIKYELTHWPDKLNAVFPSDYFASTDFVDRTVTNREFPSKVTAVPKTQKGPRIVAAEPTAHQWIQGGIQRWFESAIERSFLRNSITIRDQEPSRELALQASITGKLATVDLSAASDRLCTRLVEFFFQSNVSILDALHASRTRTFQMPDKSIHIARKFACMGSACTFPVQSIIFASLAIFALAKTRGYAKMDSALLAQLARQVRVFGDDIILPSDAYETLYQILSDLGLKVNPYKSFWSGNFRESCGMDAFKGVNVTPAYILQEYNPVDPESLVSLIECSNNFHRKGLWHSSSYLQNSVDPVVLKGLRIANRDVSQPSLFSYAPGETHLKTRWNNHLQKREVRQLVVEQKTSVVKGSGNASLLQYFVEQPDSANPYESGQPKRPSHRLTRRWKDL